MWAMVVMQFIYTLLQHCYQIGSSDTTNANISNSEARDPKEINGEGIGQSFEDDTGIV